METDRTGQCRASLQSWAGDDPDELAFLPPPAEAPSVWAIYRLLTVACLGLLGLALVMVIGATRTGPRKERGGARPKSLGPGEVRRGSSGHQRIPGGIRDRTAASAARAGDPKLVYVPESATATIAVIDARTYRVVRRVRVGRGPEHVAASGNLLLTGSAGEDSLTMIDARSAVCNAGSPPSSLQPLSLARWSEDGRRRRG